MKISVNILKTLILKLETELLFYNENTKLITGDTEYFQNINISSMGKDDEILRQISKLRTIDIIANVCLISIYLIPIGIILKLLIAYKLIYLMKWMI